MKHIHDKEEYEYYLDIGGLVIKDLQATWNMAVYGNEPLKDLHERLWHWTTAVGLANRECEESGLTLLAAGRRKSRKANGNGATAEAKAAE